MSDKKFSRQIKYLNMSHNDFVRDLKNYSKVFFPGRSKDFSDGSSGLMMMEQAAFVGDVLSFYLEQRVKNSNMATADDPDQIYNLSQFLGYDPGGPPAARGKTNFYLNVPAIVNDDGSTSPDLRYAFLFKNIQLQKNSNGVIYECLEDVDFSTVNTESPDQVRVSKRDNTGMPTHYVLKKTGEIVGSKTVTENISVGEYKAFRSVELSQPNVTEVLSVVDAEGNEYYEVSFLAQEAVFELIVNTNVDSSEVPYLLKIKSVPYRFIKRTNPLTGKTVLTFGTGKAGDVGNSFVPDPSELALDVVGKKTFSGEFIDPQNFLKTKTLGLAPYNTTLTVRFRSGGGPLTNAAEGSIRTVLSKEIDFSASGLDAEEVNLTIQSFATNNTDPIQGGANAENIKEIQENASAMFAAQGRLNTREDYIARSLSMPSSLGKIFRVSAATDCSNKNSGVKIYAIAQNSSGQLVPPTLSMKRNLKTYLSRYTRLGQSIQILDGNVVNIAIEYSIVVVPGFNKSQVKLQTLQKVREMFDVRKWQLNQPIIIDDIICAIKETEGVVTVAKIEIVNRRDGFDQREYSEFAYSIKANTKNGIILCPDNSIFEVKYINGADIKVSAI